MFHSHQILAAAAELPRKINTVPFPKIGNMTQGVGLGGMDDGLFGEFNNQATTGYCGVDFGADNAQEIAEIYLWGVANFGYDSSSGAYNIILTLRAKNGAAPTAPETDGTELGTTGVFVDPNTQTSKAIVSNDAITKWRYIWCFWETTVWSACSEVEMFRRLEI